MDFHKMPRSTILHLYLGRLFAPDRRTDGQTDGRRDPISWSRYLITTPLGFDNSFFERKRMIDDGDLT